MRPEEASVYSIRTQNSIHIMRRMKPVLFTYIIKLQTYSEKCKVQIMQTYYNILSIPSNEFLHLHQYPKVGVWKLWPD